MNPKYLPSKTFTSRVIFIAVILLVVFGLYKIIPALSRGFSNYKKNAALKSVLMKDLVQKDSNYNGIADWEESLWGLDPTKNGPENKEFIMAKKAALNPDGEGVVSDENLTANDKMARELLATIVTLEDSGNLTDDALFNISRAFGEKVAIEPITNIYSSGTLTTVSPDLDSITKYYNDFKKLNAIYQNKDMGNELTFVSQGIKNDDQKAMDVAKTVAEAYRDFGKDLMKITIPTSLVEIHLSTANNYEKVAQSIEKMATSLTNQIDGMNGVLSYKKYSDDLYANIENLQAFFQKNGIIKSSQ